jgi:hypothetical protein
MKEGLIWIGLIAVSSFYLVLRGLRETTDKVVRMSMLEDIWVGQEVYLKHSSEKALGLKEFLRWEVVDILASHTAYNIVIKSEDGQPLFVERCEVVLTIREKICNDYPLEDSIWPSRRWNSDRTNYCDL